MLMLELVAPLQAGQTNALYADPRMPQKAIIDTNILIGFCQRKVRKAKVFQTELMWKSPQTKYVMLL